LQSGLKNFKTVGITVRFSDFETKTTAKTLKKPTNSEREFRLETMKLLLPYIDTRKNPHKKLIRLIGVKLEKFNEV
jgi:DNA polymerase IV (DinB-like DNA polymerase)